MTERKWTWEEDGCNVYRSSARTAPGCHSSCGVLLYEKDGKLVKVEGDPEAPFNRGRLCARCLALVDVVNSEQRLLYPMRRAGERGENKWERISWDEAYDEIETRLKAYIDEYGAESIVVTQGTGRDNMGPSGRLCYAIGSPNWTIGFLSGNACYMPRMSAMAVTVGNSLVADCGQYFEEGWESPEYRFPEVALIWGNNPVVANADGFFGHWIVDLMKHGTELIVVDPRLNWLAGKAKHWLQLRPGTDDALIIGMLKVIIDEDLYDHEFVEKWTYGFDDLVQRVGEYDLDRIAEITGVPAEKIAAAARFYANAPTALVQWGLAVDQATNGVSTAHGIICLYSICGNVDVPGGNVFCNSLWGIAEPQWAGGWGYDLLPQEMRDKRIGLKEYPMLNFGFTCTSPDMVLEQIESGEPYPIKAMIMQANNAIACMGADCHRVHDAINKIDFVVVMDPFMTPTALACADIVLPICFWPERIGYTGYAGNNLSAITQAVEPQGESKSDWEVLVELGGRFNKEIVPWDTEEEMYDEILAPAGVTYKELREKCWMTPPYSYRKYETGKARLDGEVGFNTPTGKIELSSTVMEAIGLDPLPHYEEPLESPLSTPELAEKYPYVLTTGARPWGFFHSEQRQIPSLRALHPNPEVQMHPDVAEEKGIKEGDWVWIENNHGRCKQIAHITDTVLPNVINCDHAWWFPERDPNDGTFFGVFESNPNNLIPQCATGPTGFGAPYKNSLCTVYKVEGE